MSQRRSAKASTDARSALEGIRTHLNERYENVFCQPASTSPWGAPWSEVLRDSREADERFLAAQEALERIRGALVDAIALLGLNPHEAPSGGREGLVGLTAPEAPLYANFCLGGAALAHAFADLEHFHRLFALPSHVGRAVVLARDETMRADFERGLRDSIKDPRAANKMLKRTLDGMYRELGTSRRFARWERDPSTGEPLSEPKFAPVIGGAPPRSPGSSEWRRATLVTLLDNWFVESAEEAVRRVTDSEIGVVNLLLGGLEDLRPDELKRGVTSVVNAERKAVALSRKRRGPTTSLAGHLLK